MNHLGKSRQVGEEGNTVTSSPTKQPTRKTFYCFTHHNYEEHIDEIIRQYQLISKKGIIGFEICPTSGKKHLQGFLALKKPMRISEIKITGNPHLEACRGDEEQNIKYCSKEGNFIKWGFPKPLKILLDSQLYDWQNKLLDTIKTEPDDRSVNWYWSAQGGTGKSSFCKYLVYNMKAIVCGKGNYADIINIVFNSDMDQCNLIIFDLPRNNGNKISYSAIESIKNGMVCNTKYETGSKIFNAPHIVVFANSPPEYELLSQDRWSVFCIDTV